MGSIEIMIVLGLSGVALLWLRSRRRTRRYLLEEARSLAALEDLLTRAEAGDLEAEAALSNERKQWFSLTHPSDREDLRTRLNAVLRSKGMHRDYRELKERAQPAYAALVEAEGSGDHERHIDAAVTLLRAASSEFEGNVQRLGEELGVSLDAVRDRLNERVVRYAGELLAAAETDREAFVALRLLMERTGVTYRWSCYGDPGDLKRVGVKPLPYPRNWNQLVARYFRNPSLRDFAPERGIVYGELRLRAAAAIATHDIAEAKLVLAYCNHKFGAREEVGDYLAAQLALMVEPHETARAVSASEERR